MAKRYFTNFKIELAYKFLFKKIKAESWENIHNILEITSGDNLPKHKMVKGDYYVYGGGGITDNTHNKFNIDYDTIGIGRVGARCGCVFKIKKKSWVTDNALLIKNYDKRFNLDFLKHYLNYLNLGQFANNAMQPVISKTRISSIKLPVISLTEQKRIVKILDSLEVKNHSNIIIDTSLSSKIRIVDNWEGLLDEITKQKEYITQLKQSILQEAIQGKLTEDWRKENPDVEPASKLLKRIKAEKEKLIKEKKIRKEKPLPPIMEEEIPFELPQGWVWCRFKDIVNFQLGKTPASKQASYWINGTIDWLNISDMADGGFIHKTSKKITEKAVKDVFKTQKIVPVDTLLMSFKLTVGKVSINKIPLFHNEAIISIFPYTDILQSFLFNILPVVTDLSVSKKVLMGQTFNSTSLANMIFPLPPKEEQQAIVEKVENLMQKVSTMEEEINKSEQNAQMLMQAVLKEAFEDKKE